MPVDEFVEHRTDILHTYGQPPLYLAARWASKNLGKGFPNQRPQGRVMSVDSGMDFEEELFSLVGRDALYEYS